MKIWIEMCDDEPVAIWLNAADAMEAVVKSPCPMARAIEFDIFVTGNTSRRGEVWKEEGR